MVYNSMLQGYGVSHLIRGAWIEIFNRFGDGAYCRASHLIRGAWIEIGSAHKMLIAKDVASHTRCVD